MSSWSNLALEDAAKQRAWEQLLGRLEVRQRADDGAGVAGAAECFVHDRLDGPGAAAALGAASEAVIHLKRRARRVDAERLAHLYIREHVA